MATYICKLTNGCNMRCSYCCVGDKSSYQIITPNQFYNDILFIANNVSSLHEKETDIILHGGESTLFSATECSKVIKRIMSEFPNVNFRWKIQTNGFYLSDSWLNLMKEYNFSVGVSIDGYREHHDITRRDCGGNCTFEKIKENIIRLKHNNISVSALMVVTKKAIGKPLDFLKWYSDNDIPIKINPLLKCGEAMEKEDLFLSSGDYATYLISVFEYVVNNKLRLSVNPIDDMFNRIVNDVNYGECTFSEDCSRNFLALDYVGNIYQCGRFCDESIYLMGNVKDMVEYPFSKPKQIIDKIISLKKTNKCVSCEFVKYCNGGCPFVNLISLAEKSVGNPLCEDYQKIYKYLITDGIDMYCNKLEERREQLLRIL